MVRDFLDIRNSSSYQLLKNTRKNGSYIRLGGYDAQGTFVEIPYSINFVFTAHTMIGRARLDNIHHCLNIILRDKIPGDLIETGVWKGGATIFMRGFLAAHDITDRNVWVADSFAGLPKPTYLQDQGWDLSQEVAPYLSISIEDVKALFECYDLLDDQVKFLKGWFSETLPRAPIEKLALLRLDGDLYESTMDALESLYSKLSMGGFVIIDDYRALPQCEQAVTDFRNKYDIKEKIIEIDPVSVYWQKI